MNTQIRIPVMSNNTYAGSSLPDDWQNWQIKSFRDIRRVSGSTDKDRFIGVPVSGDSMKNFGILHGDLLITRITTEYESGKIGIWQTPSGRVAKFASENSIGSVTLHNENGWKQTWDSEDIKLIGIVVRVERDLK